jgi:hypothetical protein
MSTNKQSDLARSNPVVSSQSAAEIAAAEMKAKPKESARPSTSSNQNPPSPETNTLNRSALGSLEDVVQRQAELDAHSMRTHLQTVYNSTLVEKLGDLLGENPQDYFRIPGEAFTVHALPSTSYLHTVDCPALPSAD